MGKGSDSSPLGDNSRGVGSGGDNIDDKFTQELKSATSLFVKVGVEGAGPADLDLPGPKQFLRELGAQSKAAVTAASRGGRATLGFVRAVRNTQVVTFSIALEFRLTRSNSALSRRWRGA